MIHDLFIVDEYLISSSPQWWHPIVASITQFFSFSPSSLGPCTTLFSTTGQVHLRPIYDASFSTAVSPSLRQRVLGRGNALSSGLNLAWILIRQQFRSVGCEVTEHQRKSGNLCTRSQNQILISSSDTADGVSTPDSVIIPEIRSGGYSSLAWLRYM